MTMTKPGIEEIVRGTTKTELHPLHENVKSYYGKAVIVETNTMRYLYSYDTLVVAVSFETDTIVLHNEYAWSLTTLRHIKEFLQQHGKPKYTKAELLKIDFLQYVKAWEE